MHTVLCYVTSHLSSRLKLLPSLLDVLVELEQDRYTVGEEEGVVTVCATLAGQLQRNVAVTLSTMEGTATGQCEHQD